MWLYPCFLAPNKLFPVSLDLIGPTLLI
uniref:Uncharacterized protein n=1 Tax=Rhizophora mucronata TaxID=61149 RepID=A0A2P2PFY3_RHIMU